MFIDILRFFMSLRARLSYVASPASIMSLSLESSDGGGGRRVGSSPVPDVDGPAAVPRALNPWAIWVETADISVAYNAGSTLGGSTGGAASSAVTLSAAALLCDRVRFGMLQTRDMHQIHATTRPAIHLAGRTTPPPSTLPIARTGSWSLPSTSGRCVPSPRGEG